MMYLLSKSQVPSSIASLSRLLSTVSISPNISFGFVLKSCMCSVIAWILLSYFETLHERSICRDAFFWCQGLRAYLAGSKL